MITIGLKSNIVLAILISIFGIQCKTKNKEKKEGNNDEKEYSYAVKRSNNSHEINSLWDKEIWNKTKAISIDNYMGDKPSHFPKTKVKLRYDEENIYVIFSVADQYIRAIAKEANGRVWEDSCVEFFFSPGPDTERGYFNFEANCSGVFLFEYHLDNGDTKGFVSIEDRKNIEISHSLKKNVEQESDLPESWTLEYSIPLSMLSNYMKVEKPGTGVSWRANFYKCADKTSHPHWLTRAEVDYPNPKFHLPDFFGRLDFE